MFLEDAISEYDFHCIAKGYTKKTMINKRQEYKQLKAFLEKKRGIHKLNSIYTDDLRAYIRFKQQKGLQPQSVESMAKMIADFFNWCISEEYLSENRMRKVELPKVPKKILEGFTTEEVLSMIQAFDYSSY